MWRTSSRWVCRTSRVQRLDAEDLRNDRHAARSLQALLFGRPAARGDYEELGAELDACLRGVMIILAEEVGECGALDQARLEWNRIIDLEPDHAGLAAKQAALLFALHARRCASALCSRTPSCWRTCAGACCP